MTTALVTDSNAQLPAALRERFGVRVVPLTVTVAGVDHLEGVDLDEADFYARLAEGAAVATAAPSPGRFLAVYQAAADAGATDVVSVHLGSEISGTCGAATVAAGMSPIPVSVVDTGTASFAVACCVWAAGDALAAGGSAASAVAQAERVASTIGNVFVVGALDLAQEGGRLALAGPDTEDGPGEAKAGLPVLALEGGRMRVVARVSSLADALDTMAAYLDVQAGDGPVRVGVGDAAAPALGDALVARLEALPITREIVRYRIGPSVGAHTGAGTVGAVFYPVPS